MPNFRCLALLICAAVSLPVHATVEGTLDVLFGLDNPSPAEWEHWYGEMRSYRARALDAASFDGAIYQDPAQAWSETAFRQFYVFMFDQEFYRDGRYRVPELLRTLERRFGKIDSVLLWHAYPQLGYDLR